VVKIKIKPEIQMDNFFKTITSVCGIKNKITKNIVKRKKIKPKIILNYKILYYHKE